MQPDVQPPSEAARRDVIQPMPQLDPEQYVALRGDIAKNGVLVPVAVDQFGRVIDGNNRMAIAAELGIACPRVEVEVADDDSAIDMALALNCARRHLTQEQKRALIKADVVRRPGDSDRAIARRIGCSPSTVGTVRRSMAEPSNLDSRSPMTTEEAERWRVGWEADMDKRLMEARAALYAMVGQALTNHVSVAEVVGALTMARMRHMRRPERDPEALRIYAELVYDYVIEVTTWEATLEQFPPHPAADPTPEEREWLIESIVMMGDHRHPADEEVDG